MSAIRTVLMKLCWTPPEFQQLDQIGIVVPLLLSLPTLRASNGMAKHHALSTITTAGCVLDAHDAQSEHFPVIITNPSLSSQCPWVRGTDEQPSLH